jgi:hypothetical protein
MKLKAVVRRLCEACVHGSDALCLEKDSLPSGVAGAQTILRRVLKLAQIHNANQ